MNTLVTGANGHVGAALCRELIRAGHPVRALVFEPSPILHGLEIEEVQGDITRSETLDDPMRDVDVVFHLASLVSIDPRDAAIQQRVNALGARNVAEAALAAGVKRMVHFSSIEAFQLNPRNEPLVESRPRVDAASASESSPYAYTKALGERAVRSVGRKGLDVVVVHPVAVAGPYDLGRSLIGALMRDLYRGRRPVVVRGHFDWVDCRDVALGALAAANHGRDGESYILGGHRATMPELNALLKNAGGSGRKLLELPISVAHLTVPLLHVASRVLGTRALVTRHALNLLNNPPEIRCTKAGHELGYAPRPLSETIRDSVTFYRSHGLLEMTAFDKVVDIAIVGSGAGGLTGALAAADRGASVLVLERGPLFGGTSAMSGGAIWVPMNEHLAELGLSDDADKALSYLRSTVGDGLDEARACAYVARARDLVRFVESRTPLRFRPLAGYPDYFAEQPAGMAEGRTLGVLPTLPPGSEVAKRLVVPHPQWRMFLGLDMVDRATEAPRLMSTGLRDRAWAARRLAARIGERALPWLRRRRRVCAGQALIAHLLAAACARGAELWSRSPAVELIHEGDRVTGVVIERQGVRLRVRANKGVLLAAGGFERNADMLREHHPSPTSPTFSAGGPYSFGDAIRMAKSVGADLELMDSALLAPVVPVPNSTAACIIALEKGFPGAIVVDQGGRRFADESLPFPAFGTAMREHHCREGTAAPAYLIFDAVFRRRYPAGPVLASFMQPDWAAERAFRAGLLVRADSLAELARALTIPTANLESTVARWNGQVEQGRDDDFGRGETVIARSYGDQGKRQPSLGPIRSGPFYAMPIQAGNLGTLGGVAVDTVGRARRTGGAIIDGLFAVGNCAAPLVGHSYPASGLTLGPAMVFALAAMGAALGDDASPGDEAGAIHAANEQPRPIAATVGG